jgi:translation initiation factor IF-2
LAKIRVHELAKKIDVGSEAVLKVLQEAGFSIKSHMSGLEAEAAALVESHFKDKKAAGKTTVKPKKSPKKPKTVETKAKKKEVEKARPKAKGKAKAKAAPPAGGEKLTEPRRKPPRPEKKTAARPGAPARGKEKGAPPRTVSPAPKTKPDRKPHAGGKPARPKPAVDIRERRPKGRRPKPAAKRSAADIEAQQKAVRESVRRTLAKLEVTRRTKRRKVKSKEEETEESTSVLLSENVTVQELAEALDLNTEDIMEKCEDLGVQVISGQNLNRELIELIADDLGRTVEFEMEYGESQLAEVIKVDPAKLKPRAPIVTVMGHVDHGKTSILDYIRKTNVAGGEAGGITQHIGAYEVETPQGKITFIDTPGHEAFTAMRARGAQVTDIVVLVVAADDGVMPQTVEAINHTRAANVPMIVAINKMDLPAANPNNVKQHLSKHGIVVESFSGDIIDVEVSAKTGEGIDKLLEMIVLQGEMLELTADPDAPPQSVVIEVKKEEGRGILTTVLVKQGTLRVGDAFVSGLHCGKVRALLDHRGKNIKEAGPSTPVLVLGCSGLPETGDSFIVMDDERSVRDISVKRQAARKDKDRQAPKKLTLEELYSQIKEGELKELNILIKGDTNGSVEALTDNLQNLSVEDVKVKIVHAAVGAVSEYDVLLASSTNAIIIGFNVKIPPKVQDVAQREKVEIRSYNIIYECIAEVDDAMKGLLEPEKVERVLGRAEVRKVFRISRLGTIAGSYVTDGSIMRNAMVRVLREGETIYESKISSLKRFHDDTKEVSKDFECGIGVQGFNDFHEGDILEAFIIEEKARV